MRLRYAIVFVSDMTRSVSFYRDVLGLPLKFESPGWTEKRVPCLQEPKSVFGARIAQYADPDGLAISVSEERRA